MSLRLNAAREFNQEWGRSYIYLFNFLKLFFDQLFEDEFDAKYLKPNRPVIYTGMGRDLACSKWTVNRLGRMTNKIQVRGQTDQETYRKGTQYRMHEFTMADYVRDLVNDHPRSKSRYLATLNIKRALRGLRFVLGK